MVWEPLAAFSASVLVGVFEYMPPVTPVEGGLTLNTRGSAGTCIFWGVGLDCMLVFGLCPRTESHEGQGPEAGAPDKWHNFAMNLNFCCERDTDTETGRTSERRERERERDSLIQDSFTFG